MGGKVVENNDVPRRQDWGQLGFHIAREHFAVHGAIDYERRNQAVAPQSGNEGLCFPMTEWCGCSEAFAFWGTPPEPGHFRCSASLIEKYQPMRFSAHDRLAFLYPFKSLLLNVGPLLFGGQQGFFYRSVHWPIKIGTGWINECSPLGRPIPLSIQPD